MPQQGRGEPGHQPQHHIPATGKDWCLGTALLTKLVWAEQPASGEFC